MINNITLLLLRNSEYIQFLTDTLDIVSKNNPDALKVSAQYDALLEVKDEIEKLFQKSQGSTVTDEIEILDQRRDNAINGIGFQIKAFTYSADAEIVKHAKILSDYLSLFGPRIAKDSYQGETTTLRSIINDWNNKPHLQQAVSQLNLSGWLKELEQANNSFTIAFANRNEARAMAPTNNIKALRKTADELYQKLRARLNSSFDISDGAEPWVNIVNLLNQNIDNYKALLKHRNTKRL